MKRKELAKNITQEFYFLDFNGQTFDLSKSKSNENLIRKFNEFDLQGKCESHLEKIRLYKSKNTNSMKFRKMNIYSKFFSPWEFQVLI